MDFYRHQTESRRNSRWLLTLYLSGVVALGLLSSLMISLMLLPIRWLLKPPDVTHPLFSLGEMGTITLVVMGICLAISALRYQSYKQGGWKIAQRLGGRRVASQPADFKEQQLRNVVEEMALASSLPVSAVFVQDHERGINAFAAGCGIHDAVLVITQGALDALDRDELQAVMAHELSHIRNGDTRLNTLLASGLSGLLFIAQLADWLNRLGQSASRDYDSNKSPLLQDCVALLGYGGVVFGRLLGAAVNRQREALADASAVQFCRHPEALANALKKVAGHPYASLVFHPASAEFQHLFFAQGLPSTFAGRLATHPPLAERIRLLQPDWDGQYIRTGTRMSQQEYLETADLPVRERTDPDVTAVWRQSPHQQVSLNELDLDAPQEWLPLLPSELQHAVHDHELASCVIAAYLLSTDLAIRHRQLREEPQKEQIENMCRHLLPAKLRLGVLELAVATIQQQPPQQQSALLERVQCFIEADEHISLFEWLLVQWLRHELSPNSSSGISFRRIEESADDLFNILTSLDRAALEQSARHQPLAQRVLTHLSLPVPSATPDKQGWHEHAQSLEKLIRSAPGVKLRILQALSQEMEADGVITDIEFEVFRMLSLCFELPLTAPRSGQATT